MSDPDPYSAFDYTQEEVDLLREHDENEELHPFIPGNFGGFESCRTCGDDSSGLMHNNTWRNVEPLMDYMSESEYRRDQAERSGNSSANWGFHVDY